MTSDQVMYFCDTHLPPVILGRDRVTNLDADHDNDGEEQNDENDNEDDGELSIT